MNATAQAQFNEVLSHRDDGVIVHVDLAKSVFQVCVADRTWQVRQSHRLTRGQFERFFVNRSIARVVMEACGSAHHWGRWLGIDVVLLPARYVGAFDRRNKTDAADAAALLKAAREQDIEPVRIKSIEQQALQALHRTRSLWKADRTRRINTLRGFCREFGIAIAQGARVGVLAEPHSAIPELLRPTAVLLIEEIRLLEARIGQLERELSALVSTNPHAPRC